MLVTKAFLNSFLSKDCCDAAKIGSYYVFLKLSDCAPFLMITKLKLPRQFYPALLQIITEGGKSWGWGGIESSLYHAIFWKKIQYILFVGFFLNIKEESDTLSKHFNDLVCNIHFWLWFFQTSANLSFLLPHRPSITIYFNS